MGLFNQDYDKPGKGVRKNEPDKKGAALFWELFTRKWRSYILLNIVYVITCIPAFLYYLFISNGLTSNMPVSIMISGLMMVFFAASPFKSGFVYVIRNFVRQEHAWTVSNFFSKTMENFRQSVCIFFIDLVVSTGFMFAIHFYSQASEANVWMNIFLAIVIIAMILYAIMQSFIWCMLVTFELKIKDIYKNSYLLSMATIPTNLLSIAIRVAATAFVFGILPAALLALFVYLSAVTLLEQILAYPTIKKFMLSEPKETEESDDEVDLDELELGDDSEEKDD